MHHAERDAARVHSMLREISRSREVQSRHGHGEGGLTVYSWEAGYQKGLEFAVRLTRDTMPDVDLREDKETREHGQEGDAPRAGRPPARGG